LLLGSISLVIGFWLAGSLSTIFGAAGFWEPAIGFATLVVTEKITMETYSREPRDLPVALRLLNAAKIGFYVGIVLDTLKLAG